jgi:Zn-dependent protease with chaperone function
LAESHCGSSGGYLASHPSTDERMRRLRLLAASSKAM